MKIVCPTCQQSIPADDVNVAKDVAFCRICDEAYSLAIMVECGDASNSELAEPPSGSWFTTGENEWQVGATTRSAAAAGILIPFTVVWSGGSLIGIYGTQIWNGDFSITTSLVGIPFVLGSVVLICVSVISVLGQVVLRGCDDDAVLFTGVRR